MWKPGDSYLLGVDKERRGNYRGMMSVPCELSLRKIICYQVAFRSVRELSELSGKITVLPRGTITAKLPFEKKATQVNLTWVHPQHGKTTLEVQNLQMMMDFTKKRWISTTRELGERLPVSHWKKPKPANCIC